MLIHGMGRSRASMALLGARLRRGGHTTSSFGYLVAREALDSIAARFIAHVAGVAEAAQVAKQGMAAEPFRYAIVGHSLGGIITRLASPELTPGLERFIMLAPPNRQPAIARALSKSVIFRALTQDAGRRLVDAAFYESLPKPDVPTLIVTGTAGPRTRWLPFSGDANDGILRVDETELPGASRYDVPAIHTFIMNRRDVTAAILRFLEADGAGAHRASEAL